MSDVAAVEGAGGKPVRSGAAIARFAGTTVLGLVVDLWTKVLAVRHLGAGGVVRLVPGWLHFEYVENRGAVFGMGQGYRWLFVVVSVGAILFLTALFLGSGKQRLYQFLLGMLLAGVLGNMYDRVTLGYVRDMIHALPGWRVPGAWVVMGYPGPQREVFPYIFNVADSLLCVGVGSMVVYSLFMGDRRVEAVEAVREETTA